MEAEKRDPENEVGSSLDSFSASLQVQSSWFHSQSDSVEKTVLRRTCFVNGIQTKKMNIPIEVSIITNAETVATIS